MAKVEGSELVATTLKGLGADHVFTVVGGPVIEAVGRCGDLGIRPIGVRHEQAAAMMAQAYGYVAGKVGVCLLASGPGVTNAVTGAHVAWDNCWPLVILGGSTHTRQRGLMAFQETESVAMMRPVTKWAVQVDSADRIPEYLTMAFHKAMSGRPGPVYVDLPSDILAGQVELPDDGPRAFLTQRPPQPTRALGDPAQVRRAAELLLQAERPLLLIGKGVRWGEPYAELTEMVESLGIPFLPTPMGRGTIPDDHRLCASAARTYAMRNADVVLAVGTRFNWMWQYGRTLARDTQVIHIDIEPEEIGIQRDVTVGIVGDTKQVLRQILDDLGGKTIGLAGHRSESAWQKNLKEQQDKNEAALTPLLNADAVPMNHHRMLREVRDAIPRDAIISVDGQVVLATGRQVLPSYHPASRLNSGSNGCMGVGIPFAIGAKLAQPHRTVISVNGDCAFGFNGMELETSIRHNAPVIFIVDNNEGIMGNILESRMFRSETHEHVATYPPGIRYDKIIEAFGGHAEHVERPEDMRPALERALAAGVSACINVRIDPNAMWPAPTAGRASGLMGY